MSRYIANTAILAKAETTPGTDAVPTGAADACLVSNVSITPLDAQMVDRKLIQGFFGTSQQLLTTANVKFSYAVELAGSGTAGTAPQWGDMLLGCACAEASLTAPVRVEYTPVSTALKTLTHYWYDDGVLHKALGCMGNAKLSAKIGDVPRLSFDWIGLDGTASAASNPALTQTAWKVPPVMNKASVIDITLGCTYATGALTGGTAYNSTGLEIDFANKVNFTPFLSTESVDITDRDSSGSMELNLTAAQEVALLAMVKANTLTSIGFTIGTTAGNKFILYFPAVQLLKPTKKEVNGVRTCAYELKLTPLVGNDEFRIVCL